jgi:hypothetical protein
MHGPMNVKLILFLFLIPINMGKRCLLSEHSVACILTCADDEVQTDDALGGRKGRGVTTAHTDLFG